MASILITGSGRRLGRGLALNYALKGWNVILHYNNSNEIAYHTLKEIKSIGVNATIFQADVKNFDDFKAGFERILNDIEYPEVLVNNAAIYPSSRNLSNTDEWLWDEVMNTNLKAYFLISKLFSEKAKTGSRVINIASLGAFQIWKGRIPYNVSKAGVIQLTKALAKDLAPKISVNSVSPGSIDIENEAPTDGLALKVENIPMKRYGNIKDVFDAVYFFSTASSYITGQNINVDGGYYL
ncbi:MAG: SDR family oxidoreductase [Candidatus Kapabacteria bacterium]|nr:SDR family oxidoreductase [Ignavibacteriota bacterium]MCW5884698.1 SDR family oxidoreductase [Candidatus Kapabacteria bacterium]